MSFLSDASIDDAVSGNANESTRKRRRDEQNTPRAIDRRPFTIQTDSSDPFSQPRTLTPLCLLSRVQLPLAYLDTAQDGSRLFAAVVQLLETCHDDRNDTKVLIVEDKRAGRLYAVERVQRRRYALCRLGTWVKEQDVMTRATLDVRPDEPPKKRCALQVEGGNRPWWMSASVHVRKEGVGDAWLRESRPKLGMQSAAGSATEVLSTNSSSSSAQGGPQEPVHQDLEPADASSALLIPSPAALEELSRQYLDAVYLSRTPLAYFTKGPLARARTAFSTQPMELVAFLRGAILSSSVMDKKFRDVVANHVKELPIYDLEGSAVKPKPRKKRKWKSKRDKSGLFVDEKEHIEQWWRRDDDAGGVTNSAEKLEVVLRRRTTKLRNRETFLQIVLILETLALEATVAVADPTLGDTKEPESQAVEAQPTTVEGKKSKKKKEPEISDTLDALIDRLTIWHSLEINSPVKTGTNVSGGATGEVNDDLKTFASEVIMPFYGSRISEQANAASKKLGGPTLPTPGKKFSVAPRKPGEPAVRQGPEKVPRKPLGRVSTDTLNRTDKRPPILHRSATDSDALGSCIKRENSESPAILENIPSAKVGTLPAKPGGPQKRVSLLHQMSANRREVDLSAMSRANELKMRKNAQVEEQLRDALITIKKPNRTLAHEEVAKIADETFAKAVGKGRIAGNVRRAIQKTSIDATPRAIKATPAPRRRPQQRSEKSTSMVPSSSTRLFARPVDLPNSSVAVPQTGHRPRHTSNVEDTPSRGFAHFMPKGLARQPGTLLESPTASRTAPISETPSRPLSMPSLARTSVTSPPARNVGFAGRLEASQLAAAASSGSREKSGGGAGHDSKALYNDLGWDMSDEYEELD